jgi:hypothetical protein
MCFPALLAPLAGIGGATAAGATAAAATGAAAGGLTFGGLLQVVGTVASIAGSLSQGNMAVDAGNEQIAELQAKAQTEAELTATADMRKRQEWRAATAQQRAELAKRGISLDSPTAMLLGRTAAQEMSFESQAIRSDGEAKRRELTGAQRVVKAQAEDAFIKSRFSAAGSLLTAAPELWPGITDKRVLG